ncbi:hypothetical protein Pmani_014899 [Petrolisthes manimaculis]|uniref:HTH CENPB-type domain-containing protein n=1 Tax=Petrolisthes manimaculis TaxID=1843537 RepID=A0AAE1UAH9_9EUCA|nr:hypothetical protein Pmani_014899 [Petrolisthes manimaculis]
MPLSEQLICEKARTIFQDLKKEHGKEDNSSETFVASKGWFNRFKCRGDLKNRRIYGEAASADEEGAKKFLEQLEKIITEEEYLPQLIFNAVRATENGKKTLREFWKDFNIYTAVKNIGESWEEVTESNMNGVWKKLCPYLVNDFKGFDEACTLRKHLRRHHLSEWVSEGRVGGAAPSCVCDNNNNTDCGRMTPLDNILVRGGWCGVEYTRLANITHYVQ